MVDRIQPLLLLALASLVLLFTAWVYWPGQAGPALLDDRSSVLVLGDLKTHPEQAWDYVAGDKSGPLGRPVSIASFVAEKLWLDGELPTSKRINVLLHLLNGALVIWLFSLLFRHIHAPGHHWLALVLGAAWLLAPLFVSTVLYVVQRMAMLATTFMLLTCICFIHWRSRFATGRFSIILAGLTLLSFVLALLSKENAIVVVPVLLLTEALWFGFRDAAGRVIPWLKQGTLAAIGLGALGVLAYLSHRDAAAAFHFRYFSLEERLLTEARILWDYIAQLFLPDMARLGIYHDDYRVSTSLDQPVETLQAVLGWLAVAVGLALLIFRQWGRYLALGICWYLVGHSVESTVFPLELYFEHRNYFPALGLLLSVGVAVAYVSTGWPQVRAPLLAYLSCYGLWLATLTGSQVQIWSSQPLLILSNLNGHPDSFRANADMAVQMANLGEFDAARAYSARAFALSKGEREGDRGVRDLALACIAGQPEDPSIIPELGTVNPRRPFSSVVTMLTLVRLLQDNECPAFDRLGFADRMVEIFLAPGSVATAAPNLFYSLAVLENTLQRWDIADAYADKFLEQSPENTAGLLMKLHFATALGKVDAASALKARLQEKSEQGHLTVGEQQTLALYLEN